MKDILDYGPRRSGRTTRVVDECIQELFTKGYTLCIDHHPTEDMRKYVFRIVTRRIQMEHGVYDTKGILYNAVDYFIAFPGRHEEAKQEFRKFKSLQQEYDRRR